MGIKELKDRPALAEVLPKGGIGCEMGVFKGEHAEQLLLAEPKKLHLIDFWTHWANYRRKDWLDNKEETIRRFKGNPVVKIHDGKVEKILPKFPDNHFDWIYIDTFHAYEPVTRDIKLAYKKIKHGGIMCGHDFIVAHEDFGTSVVRAVIEFLQSGNHEMIALTNRAWADWAIKLNKK